MEAFEERGKQENPGRNLSEQCTEPANPTRKGRWNWESNPGHIGGRKVLSPPRHHCLCPLPHHDLASEQLEGLSICEKHRQGIGKNWRLCRTYQSALHSVAGRRSSRREMQLIWSCLMSEPSSTTRPHFVINITSKRFFRAEFHREPDNKLSKSDIKKKIVSEGSNTLRKSHHLHHWNTGEGLPKWSNP